MKRFWRYCSGNFRINSTYFNLKLVFQYIKLSVCLEVKVNKIWFGYMKFFCKNLEDFHSEV